MACPTCGSEQTPGAKFCDQCGARMAALCIGCGVELRAGARFCSECGARQDEQTPPLSPAPVASAAESTVAERRVTNVLFGDLVGFTSLSETRDHEEVRELLSMYFDRCRRIVGRYGGTVEKFIGDAVMAVWGVPTAHGDDAERAVRAGVELVRAVESIGDELGVAGLTLRVGIVTGEVAVTLGAQYEGMVAGDAVNTAARVQAAATPGEVWVDESTRLLTSGAVTYVDAGSHQLKGKIEAVPLWSVRAVVAGVGGAQRADGLEAPLTGRARELRLVKDLFHGVEESGRPALVLVDGEPGVGKSRLGWEFEKYVDGLRVDFRWHSTRCPAYGDGVAFWPIAEAVRGRLGLIEADPDADSLGALDVWLARCVTDDEEAAWLRPRVLALLGSNTTGGFDRDDLFAAWRTFFERAREGLAAVVLLIDDAHHADDGTVAFVEHVLANSDEPLFVMLMARPELLQRWPSLATNRHATVFHLGALDGAEMAELFDGLVSGLPREVRDGLVERAHGVPLYAIETVRSLIDRDLVVPRGGVYVLPDPSRVDLASIGAPASLQALVAARLDSLSAEQRRVVTDASVLGVTFTRDGIEALAHDVDGLDGTLAALVRLEILSVVGSRLSAEYGQYRFVQSVVRQVAYGTQSRRDRKARHIAVARYFESGEEASGGGFAPILAQHYLDAIAASADHDEDVPDLRASAVEHLVRAAEHARAVGAPGEAQRYLETALAHADAAASAQIHLDAAWAAYEAGDLASVLAHTDAASAGFGAVGDAIGAGGAAAVRAQALNRFGADNAAALDVAFPHWEALHGVAGAEHVLLHLARAIGSARFALNQDAADVTLERIRIAEAIGDRATLADALVSLGLVHIQRTPTLAAILTRAGVDMARAQQRHRTVSRGLGNLASIASGTSLPDVAALLDESIEATRKSGGDRYLENTMALNGAILSCLTGTWQRAEELLDGLGTGSFEGFIAPFIDAMVSDATGRPRRYPTPVVDDRNVDDEVLLAYCAAADVMDARLRGDVEEAAARGVEAVERVVPSCGLADDTVYIWPYAAEAEIAAGDPDALARVLAPIDDAPPGLLGAALRAHRRRGAGLIAIRDRVADAVEPNLRAAIAGFDEWGSPVYRARAQAELAQWLETQGRTEDAAPLRRAAVDLFESLGAAGWLAQLGWDRTDDAMPTTVAGA